MKRKYWRELREFASHSAGAFVRVAYKDSPRLQPLFELFPWREEFVHAGQPGSAFTTRLLPYYPTVAVFEALGLNPTRYVGMAEVAYNPDLSQWLL